MGALFRPNWDSSWGGRTREIRRWQVLLVALATFLVGMLVGSTTADDSGTAEIITLGDGATSDSAGTGTGAGTGAGGDSASTTTTTTLASTVTRPAAEVKLLVLNGAKLPGAARELTNDLVGRGYAPGTPGDSELHPQNTVYFQPAFEADCNAVATLVAEFTGARTATVPLFDPVQVPAAAGLDCLVVLGRAFNLTAASA